MLSYCQCATTGLKDIGDIPAAQPEGHFEPSVYFLRFWVFHVGASFIMDNIYVYTHTYIKVNNCYYCSIYLSIYIYILLSSLLYMDRFIRLFSANIQALRELA